MSTVRLSVDPLRHPDCVTATIQVSAGGEPLTLELTVPSGPCAPEDMLPILHGLSSLFADRAAAATARAGKPVSCRLGCAHCCRQLVPVTGAEARHLKRLVDAMPEPRRTAVRARFAAALDRLAAAGRLEALEDGRPITGEQGLDYLRLGVDCPFLEDEACSIHPDRPMGCREYLVTSPPANCAETAERRIAPVALSWDVLLSAIRAGGAEGRMPLVLALRDANRVPGTAATGADRLRALFAAIAPPPPRA
jgi:Fe-S-cluster containining protein